jgi:hypothetical protein
MRRMLSGGLGLAVLALLTGIVLQHVVPRPARAAGETVSVTLPTMVVHLAPGPHVDEVEALCSTCHTLRYIVMQPPLPRKAWAAEVNKMIHAFGAPIPEDKVPDIVDYLATHYGNGK